MLLKRLLTVAVMSTFIDTGTAAFAEDKPPVTLTVQMSVTEKGFEPNLVKVKKDETVNLVITRKTERTCATSIVIDDYGVNMKLPLNTPVTVTFTPTKSGEVRYGCASGKMVGGILLVE